jgi:GNAT superfamily N-acetyltransferase
MADTEPIHPSKMIMSKEIFVRFAEPRERTRLKAMQAFSMRSLGAAYYEAEVLDAFVADVGTMDDMLLADGTYLVAYSGTEIIGCGGWTSRRSAHEARIVRSAAQAARTATVCSVYIHPSFARRGIATALMSAIENEILSAGFDTASLTATLSSIPLYRRLGYRSGDAVAVELRNGMSFVAIKMDKRLRSSALRAA